MQHQCNLAAKESGLECTFMNNDDFTVLVSGGSRWHWVSMCTVWLSHLKWLSRATYLHQILCEAWIFLHGNYSDDSEGHSYGQLVTGSLIKTTCLPVHHILCSFLAKRLITQVTQFPIQPRFGALRLLTFPQTKITFEREEISDCQWGSGKYDGEADGDWENCVRSQGTYFEGVWGIIVLCTMFLVSCIFFYKCLYFSYFMAGYLLDRPCMHDLSIKTMVWGLPEGSGVAEWRGAKRGNWDNCNSINNKI